MPELDSARLLGGADVRELASALSLRPTKSRGQNFVTDANTVRRIVRAAQLVPGEHVLEIGPGLGSLTLALLAAGHPVTAVEVDPILAAALPETVQRFAPALPPGSLRVIEQDALRVRQLPDPQPSALVANLPYNISVPVLLHLLETFACLNSALVMVQAEVAARLAAGPGSRVYGVPSAKAAWYAEVCLAGPVSRSVFWPVPNVDSALVRLSRRPAPQSSVSRERVFEVIDAAFAQRRKTLRAALAGWAGSAPAAEHALLAAGVDPGARGEQLGITQFVAVAAAGAKPDD
ncbi:MAG: 16S rRNA (adenine(1518)-N(6)/adenine(1519)-N(6))-dimethyltransferase RsmA [Angustibacter sp.]